jgi:hypothetical protein
MLLDILSLQNRLAKHGKTKAERELERHRVIESGLEGWGGRGAVIPGCPHNPRGPCQLRTSSQSLPPLSRT